MRCNANLIRLRVATSAFLALLGPWVFVLALSLVATTKSTSAWNIVFLSTVVIIVIASWLASTSIALTSTELSYHSLLSWTEIPFSEIEHAEIQIGAFGWADRFRGTTRLIVSSKREQESRQLVINLKLFKKHEVDEILRILRVPQ